MWTIVIQEGFLEEEEGFNMPHEHGERSWFAWDGFYTVQ